MSKKQKNLIEKKLFIPRGLPFIKKLTEYYTNNFFRPAHYVFYERKYTVGDANVNYRVLNHWSEKDLLPNEKREKNEWHKFNFAELVWLVALQRLRKFGFSLQKIKKAKNCIFNSDGKGDSFLEFEYYIAKAWLSEDDPYIIALVDGTAQIATSQEIEIGKMFNGNKDVLLISIKSILNELGKDVIPTKPLVWLSEPEINTLHAVRRENNDEIKLKTKNGSILEIESSRTEINPPLNYEIQRKIKNDKMYGKMETQYVNGKPISVKISNKKRFDK